MVLGIFKMIFKMRSACSYVTMSGNFERSQYFNFETNFLAKEKLFQKLEYRLLVESTKIENASFPYKNYYIRSQC